MTVKFVKKRARRKPATLKAKGRRLQQEFRQLLLDVMDLDPEDVKSTPMGSQGEDLILGTESRRRFPYSVECKNQGAFAPVYDAMRQATANAGSHEPMVVLRKDRAKPLVVVDAEHFLEVWRCCIDGLDSLTK